MNDTESAVLPLILALTFAAVNIQSLVTADKKSRVLSSAEQFAHNTEEETEIA